MAITRRIWLALVALAAMPANAQTDPLTARVHVEDAERFAALFDRTEGRPTAAQLQADYLAAGSAGIGIFTPDRIVDAANLARAIEANRDRYRHAIDQCLPAARAASADLRAIYLAYRGLLPDAPLPEVYVVFGANNSAGTAGPGAQVIGLEMACADIQTAEAFRARLRGLFAHETVHTLQPPVRDEQRRDILFWALREGAADFLAGIATGNPDGRDDWGLPQERVLWSRFRQDRETLLAHWPVGGEPDQQGMAAAFHWFWNQGNAPEGWPSEAGYWIGKRILQAYYDRAADKHRALAEILALRDPDGLLAASGYAP